MNWFFSSFDKSPVRSLIFISPSAAYSPKPSTVEKLAGRSSVGTVICSPLYFPIQMTPSSFSFSLVRIEHHLSPKSAAHVKPRRISFTSCCRSITYITWLKLRISSLPSTIAASLSQPPSIEFVIQVLGVRTGLQFHVVLLGAHPRSPPCTQHSCYISTRRHWPRARQWRRACCARPPTSVSSLCDGGLYVEVADRET